MCILLVEDEPIILVVLEDTLLDAGHEVQIAFDAKEAIGQLDAQPERFSAIVTDLHMPGKLNGANLVEHARSKLPALPIVLSTARSDALTPAWIADHHVVVLDKPYPLIRLVQTLAHMLS